MEIIRFFSTTQLPNSATAQSNLAISRANRPTPSLIHLSGDGWVGSGNIQSPTLFIQFKADEFAALVSVECKLKLTSSHNSGSALTLTVILFPSQRIDSRYKSVLQFLSSFSKKDANNRLFYRRRDVSKDNNSGKIVATGSVFIEKKFIRNCGKVGHIEDVVVDSSVRGKHLGKKIIGFLSDHARAMGCYKVILDCSVENRPFYERCGFKQKEVQMVKYFV
ncbi:hypothetical protein Pfo_028624 [Paulownia fortunei]|nr:hypothetical protein Pfo_028624 [Paulownia fortunei]